MNDTGRLLTLSERARLLDLATIKIGKEKFSILDTVAHESRSTVEWPTDWGRRFGIIYALIGEKVSRDYAEQMQSPNFTATDTFLLEQVGRFIHQNSYPNPDFLNSLESALNRPSPNNCDLPRGFLNVNFFNEISSRIAAINTMIAHCLGLPTGEDEKELLQSASNITGFQFSRHSLNREERISYALPDKFWHGRHIATTEVCANGSIRGGLCHPDDYALFIGNVPGYLYWRYGKMPNSKNKKWIHEKLDRIRDWKSSSINTNTAYNWIKSSLRSGNSMGKSGQVQVIDNLKAFYLAEVFDHLGPSVPARKRRIPKRVNKRALSL